MKKSIAISVVTLCVTLQLHAQFRIESNGNTSFASSETALSVISVNSGGDPDCKVYVKADKKGYFCDRRGTSSSWVIGFNAFSRNENTNFSAGVRGDAFSYTVLNTGRSYGVLGTAGNSTSGWNYGVFGRIDGSNDGAAVYGTSSEYENGTFIDGKYAGFFNGNTKVVGDLSVTGNISGIILTPAPDDNASTRAYTNVIADDYTSKITNIDVVPYYIQEPVQLFNSDSDTIPDARVFRESEIQKTEKLHLGISSKQLKDVFPNLVYEMEDGNDAINYTELIPVLLKSIKELNDRIHELELNQGIKARKTNTSDISQAGNNNLYIGQNTPNPCTASTRVSVNIPNGNGKLVLLDSNGIALREYPICSGDKSLSIDTSNLPKGVFLYYAEINGKRTDCKRLVVTR